MSYDKKLDDVYLDTEEAIVEPPNLSLCDNYSSAYCEVKQKIPESDKIELGSRELSDTLSSRSK
jgi:hypothetical protein